MKRFVAEADRGQWTLLPECFDDFIAESKPVRVVDAFVAVLSIQHRFDPDDIQYTCHIVGEHVQCHLGRNARQSLHQEVHSAHPRLDRSERAFDRRAPRAHGVGICIEPALHSLEHMLMLPARDPALASSACTFARVR
jgi:hypothetical protein